MRKEKRDIRILDIFPELLVGPGVLVFDFKGLPKEHS